MSKTYDFPASDHVEAEDVQRLRKVWAHLKSLAGSGEPTTMTNAEAAKALEGVFWNIMGENIADGVSRENQEDMYLVAVWGNVEPSLQGPFGSEEERVQAAKDFLNENGGEGQNGVFRLEIDEEGKPSVSSFVNAEMED